MAFGVGDSVVVGSWTTWRSLYGLRGTIESVARGSSLPGPRVWLVAYACAPVICVNYCGGIHRYALSEGDLELSRKSEAPVGEFPCLVPSCRRMNDEGARTCWHCGNRLS